MLLAAPPGFVGRNPPLTVGGVALLPLSVLELIAAVFEGGLMGWVDEKDSLPVGYDCI